MMSSRNRNRRRLHVVKDKNPVEEEKPAASGVNVKQMMIIGAITAATGTIVGAVAMELYRFMRPKIPIPQPGVPPQQNPALPWPQQQAPWEPHPSGFPPVQQPFAPTTHQGSAVPPTQAQTAVPIYQQGTAYQLPPYPQANPQAQQPALPPAHQAALPAIETSPPEPLSRPELAQWQRGLEAWEHRLDRRDNES